MEKLSKSSRQATKELESYFNMQKKKNLEKLKAILREKHLKKRNQKKT